jgi:two-component system sensor histidine kinase AlgZ
MPSLVLQPLVENAVYHGIAQLPAGGTISVGVRLVGSEVRVSVENPVPSQSAHTQGHQMALANISQRLQALYGSAARLQALPRGDSYRVELSYPPGAAL